MARYFVGESPMARFCRTFGASNPATQSRRQGEGPGGWDEAGVGAVGNDAPVGVLGRYAQHIDLICRTAGYVTRTSGGVGGGSREAFPYPK
jgi:hypothetical protein